MTKLFLFEKKRLLFFSYFLAIIIFLQKSLSMTFMDGHEVVLTAYQIYLGKIPYVDFFQHHILNNFYFISPFFYFFKNTKSALIFFFSFSIFLTFLCTFFIYKICKDLKFRYPHLASLAFLISGLGTPYYFFRSEYFVMVLLIFSFFFKNYLVKSFLFVLAATTNILSIFPISIILLILFIKSKKKEKIFILIGGVFALLINVLFYYRVPISTLYYHIFTFNNKIKPVFFTGITGVIIFVLFILPILLFSIYTFFKLEKNKRGITKLIIILILGYLFQISILNIIFGFPFRLRLYDFLPVLGLSFILISAANLRHAVIIVLYIGFISILIYPLPALTFIDYTKSIEKLENCISKNATIGYTNENPRQIILRPILQYNWFAQEITKKYVNINNYELNLPNNITICGIILAKEHFFCDINTISDINKKCNISKKKSVLEIVSSFIREVFINKKNKNTY